MGDTLTGYDALSDDEMAELVADPETLHLYDAHRIVAALAAATPSTKAWHIATSDPAGGSAERARSR